MYGNETNLTYGYFIMIIGMLWQECKQLYNEGWKGYMDSANNWFDFGLLSCYLASFALRFYAMTQVRKQLVLNLWIL